METRVEQLESRLAFTEMSLEQLSEMVYQQQRTIDTLQQHIQRLEDKLRAEQEGKSAFLDNEPPPPHY
ncbi:SlyX family protein [Spirochaeta africana]|uniref:Protein SlyX homolog n=1 Tax=Spirochaeta africana (strain ATCC 700263 / DSM 8902 / Z-7692) TaxID=889378 RepID=H9UHQ5_SPIAZ|nr:SlyX family protein [Spirochaeta africana]AFG37048.1 hypothetical protein Spiaf_0959 [Spirochaeta africana DSM 8902]